MITRKDDMKVAKADNMKDGIESVKFTHMTDAEGLCNKDRLFSLIELKPGCSVGGHSHENDFEIYSILEGEGEVADDGVVKKSILGMQ